MGVALDLYQGHDPRDLPAYSLREASYYLDMPYSTLRDWVKGRWFSSGPDVEESFSPPVIDVFPSKPFALSFTNLVEAHVLASLRRTHNIPLQAVRIAIVSVQKLLNIDRPLARAQFETDGIDLFVRDVGELINASKEGQLAMKDVLHLSLKRIERDEEGLASRLFPFTRSAVDADAPKLVVMDPRISFGRAVIVGTGIPTVLVAERYFAGESIKQLVEDYHLEFDQVEEAIRCERRREAA